MAQLVLIRGLPGSGKSTMARVLAQVGYVHIEADMYFDGPDGYGFNAAELRDAHEWCVQMCDKHLDEGSSVVVANTFTELWEMARYRMLAESHGAELRIIEAKGHWRSVHNVPGYKLAQMRDRWEQLPESDAINVVKVQPPVRERVALRPVR